MGDKDATNYLLYHYCSNSTLQAILLASRPPSGVEGYLRSQAWAAQSVPAVRLSHMGMSNDSEEGKLLFPHVIRRIEEHGGYDVERVRELLFDGLALTPGLGFCLSRNGNSISQWREYADDGKGVSIGFSSAYLRAAAQLFQPMENAAQLIPVIYDPAEQKNAAQELFDFMIRRVRPDNLAELPNIVARYFSLGAYQFKSHDFRQEDEVRLYGTSPLRVSTRLEYQARDTCVTPFVTQLLLPVEGFQIIDEIVLGPKNTTPRLVVEAMCRKAGIPRVTIRKSGISMQ